jgi:murein DD-endopeptidase MepM/ murein hydrolase activator NlpD
MASPRYTVLIANRNTGAVRRLTLSRRTAVVAAMCLASVPLFLGLGAGGASPVELEAVKLANDSLKVENESYRNATGELAEQISTLQTALSQLSEQAELDPAARQALAKSVVVLKSRAAGGAAIPVPAASTTESAEGTFGILKNLLGALENRLASVKTKVENQQAIARATPSIWPIAGWLSSSYGNRKDPFNGGPDFHPGLDISADRGTPVRATADGTVEAAGYNGAYGNSVMIAHGYGIETRFGHLSGYAVSVGQQIHRGDVIGYVGSTGRATAAHLHYEILVNGSPINPLRLLGKP